MRKVILILTSFILWFGTFVYAQTQIFNSGAEWCSFKKSNSSVLNNWFDSPNSPRHSYDVLDYKLNLDIYNCFKSPYPKTFTANIEIKFKVDSVLNTIKLNAVNTSLAIDSIRLIGGPSLSFTHSSNILTVTMNRTYNVGEIATIKIYYRHIATTNDGAFYTYNGMVFTDCEPQGARKWYPCWDDPADKATLDLTAKVPSSVKLGSNGRLQDSTALADTIWYHWISRDPVATYLIVLTGKVNYNLDIVWWHKLSNPADSIPIRFYWNTGESTSNLNYIKSIIGPMTTYYSQKYGEHPFEKNGFCTTISGAGFTWGGMENQTLTTLCPNCWNESYVAHEFAHQWFGDMVTCATWADIFINEGFATFNEAVWKEYTGGYTAYKQQINSFASSYLSGNPGWAIYNPQWLTNPDINSLFNYAITYCKGACVLHMLRYTLGDSVFFAAIKAYATDTVNFKYKSTTVADFKDKIAQVTGQNLDWFFNAWIYQANHPYYQCGYNITNLGGNNWRLNFLAKQTQTNTGFFPMPIEIKVTFTSGPDTTVKFFNSVNNQITTFYFNRQPSTITFDPNNQIVIKQSAPLVVGINENEFNILPDKFVLNQNYPNPFNPVTNIEYSIPQDNFVKIQIFDITGREISTPVNEFKKAGRYNISFNALNLPSGVYFYKMSAGNFSDVKRMMLVK